MMQPNNTTPSNSLPKDPAATKLTVSSPAGTASTTASIIASTQNTPKIPESPNNGAQAPVITSTMSAQDISIKENTKDPALYQNAEDIIRIEHLYNSFGTHVIHEDLNMTVKKGELIALVGGSGSGKTTLLRTIIMLQKPVKGQIYLLDEPVWGSSLTEEQSLRKKFGMLFQSGALFSSLTVLENIMVPLQVHTKLSRKDMEEVAMLKLTLAGLQPQAANLLPKDISGGMIKRAGLARALALDPALLFLDEPTAGLDPVSASEFDQLMKQLKESLNLTIVMVTHDLDSIWAISDRVAFLGNKTLLACEPIQDLINDTNPLIQHYFQGPRGRAAGEAHGTKI